jgi:hypothetical protein
MRDSTSSSSRTTGIVVSLTSTRDSADQTREDRAFIDYEEIDGLIAGIDAVSRVNESMTKLAGFEARYRTLGDLEVGVFRQTRTGTAVVLASGICDQVTVNMSLDDLVKFRQMILEAKSKLDELK